MSNNFIQFDQNKKNMMNDTSYSTHTKVLNGVLGGNDVVADPQIHNKLYYQVSTFVKAFADAMDTLNISTSDSSLATLTAQITTLFSTLFNKCEVRVYNSGSQTSKVFLMGHVKYGDYSSGTPPTEAEKQFCMQFISADVSDQMATNESGDYTFTYPMEMSDVFFAMRCLVRYKRDGSYQAVQMPGIFQSIDGNLNKNITANILEEEDDYPLKDYRYIMQIYVFGITK